VSEPHPPDRESKIQRHQAERSRNVDLEIHTLSSQRIAFYPSCGKVYDGC
jgi:hypothetical protein